MDNIIQKNWWILSIYQILFNLALEKVMRSMPKRQSVERLSDNTFLAYADDIIGIIGNSRQEVVTTRTNDLIRAAKPMGLEVNQDKTKYLVMWLGEQETTRIW